MSFLGGSESEFDSADAFVPEHVPGPGPFLADHDVPRRATLTAVAEHAGIAKSTCSETLQRVERTMVREFVDDLPRRPLDADAAAADP